MNIVKQANLPIIARLGGFHLLKSYLGSMGNIMEDSGLLKVIPVYLSLEVRQPTTSWMEDVLTRQSVLTSSSMHPCINIMIGGGAWLYEDLHGEGG